MPDKLVRKAQRQQGNEFEHNKCRCFILKGKSENQNLERNKKVGIRNKKV